MIKALHAFFAGVRELFGFLNNKQLLDAGEDRGNAKQSEKVIGDVEKVQRARRNSDAGDVFDDFFDGDK